MKIHGHHAHVATPAVASTQPTSKTASTQGASSAGEPSVEKVSVSERAQALSQTSGGVDSEKVGRLKAAVASGTLAIDSRKIADQIVGSD